MRTPQNAALAGDPRRPCVAPNDVAEYVAEGSGWQATCAYGAVVVGLCGMLFQEALCGWVGLLLVAASVAHQRTHSFRLPLAAAGAFLSLFALLLGHLAAHGFNYIMGPTE